MSMERLPKLRGVIKPIAPRLDAKSVSIPFAGCRIFLGGSVPRGYGVISLNGRQVYAHRAAWQVANGPIPDGLKVLHRCDVPACINPDHLFLGTDADNMRDKREKGRDKVASGNEHGSAKLTEELVARIRSEFVAYSRTHGAAAIARRFGVSPSSVSTAVRGKTWRNA